MKTLLSRILTSVAMLSRRVRLLFRRRDMFLVTEDAFLETLSTLGISCEGDAEPLTCARCGRQLTAESIRAWIVLPEGVAFYCDTQECLGAVVNGGGAYGD